MRDRLLLLEMKLIVLKYGRAAVMEALARISESTIEELEKEIEHVSSRPKGRMVAKKRPPADQDVEERLLRERPELERLVSLYRAKLLLPTLRDVKGFLEAHSRPATVKSRQAALPRVLLTLAELPQEDLQRLEHGQGSSRDPGAFAMLANELMSPSERRKDPER